METEYVSKYSPDGGAIYQAALPAPAVHYLDGHSPQLRLLAIYYATDRHPYMEDKGLYVACRLELEYSAGIDPLGNPYWQPLEELFGENRPRLCREGCPAQGLINSLKCHLVDALAIPTAEQVEANLVWQKLPEDPDNV